MSDSVNSKRTAIAISNIVGDATMLLRDSGWDKWWVYEVAKRDIGELNPTLGQYEEAIKLLEEALGI